jgi:MFS family permease
MSTVTAAESQSTERTGWASLRDLTRYQWFVFLVAAIAWMADCMDQQLFNLARKMSLADLLGGPDQVTTWASRSTSVFLLGWATGGLVFGMYGDRIGRVRTLTYTILLYSIFTGLSAFSQGPYDYCAYRFLTGLGVGGVFAAAVALLAETMPNRARPFTLGLMQAFSAVGNCTAALMYIMLGLLELYGYLDAVKSVGLSAWRLLFLIGIVPALLVIFIQRRLNEPQSWLDAKATAKLDAAKRLGSYGQLFGGGWITRHALLGMLLSFVGVVGLWGIAFFAVDLQQMIFVPTFKAEAKIAYPLPENADADTAKNIQFQQNQYEKGQQIIWAGITSLAINIGAFIGMSVFPWMSSGIGRKPSFFIVMIAAAASVATVFWGMHTRFQIVWMNVLMGVCMLSLFSGYAIYLPELFPTRLRSTGTSFCYNVGRFIAAIGPLALGLLTTDVFDWAKTSGDASLPFRYAGLTMCSIFALGLIVLPFLPETRDKPLPE